MCEVGRTRRLLPYDVTLIRDHDGAAGPRVLRLDEAARLRCVPGRPSWAPGARSRFPRLGFPLSLARRSAAHRSQHRQAAGAAEEVAVALTCRPAAPRAPRVEPRRFALGPRRKEVSSRSTPTCSAMPAATLWRTPATTPGRCKIGWVTATSHTPCATPSCRRRGLRIFGGTELSTRQCVCGPIPRTAHP